MPFENRWCIEGRLTTRTPLHVGNGQVTTRAALDLRNGIQPGQSGESIEIAEVAMDHRNRAYIPGTTLKGTLRAWLDQRQIAPELVEAVFGSAGVERDGLSVGGKAEFCDAFALEPSLNYASPYWDVQRLTDVTVSVAIDRHTRTAKPKKLYHREFVPSDIAFQVRITGQDLTTDERDLLLYALEQFNHPATPIVIGAETSDGYGRLNWRYQEIASLTPEDVLQWLQTPTLPVGYQGLTPLSGADCATAVEQARRKFAR